MAWKKSPAAVLAALLVIHLLAHIDRNIPLGFSPQLIADLKLSGAQYGFLVGAVWVLSFGVMALVLGALADRFSRPRVIAVGLLVWSACTAASGQAQNFEQMVAARFFVAAGEAALVPAAVALLVELFPEQRRGAAVGLFFMGIPLGIGFAFLLAGSYGASHGWRDTFTTLGVMGMVLAVPLALLRERREAPAGGTPAQGQPFGQQLRAVLQLLRSQPLVWQVMAGFVLVHLVFAGLSFTQLWMVRERGFDAGSIAQKIGALQILFGTLGSVVGGVLADRIARRLPGGHAGFAALLVLICMPLLVASRFAAAGSALFYVGQCAGYFLPLAIYGPANLLVQQHTPAQLRATVTGAGMLVINVFAIAIGNAALGWVVDRLSEQGAAEPLTRILLLSDAMAALALPFFLLAARRSHGAAAALAVRPG
ncbi:MFS transporter [Pelomonas sp. SE-A7]|uniref:MFS transporter n=1 Tax=Pelomonas sp. SE-A7 TaxID=3054953 RepID=UPI00259D1706|nr:MFS transporter [Pelomonas sp. SE-A7]MDM4765769.1 MFS transporter [Pelomonas sp. SE-A7]